MYPSRSAILSEWHPLICRNGFPITVSGDHIVIPHHDTMIEADDHVIVFCTRKAQIPQVEKLFQVGAGFF